MRVVYCIYSGCHDISIPSGWISRGVQLMRGLKRAGAEVSVIIRGNSNSLRLPPDLDYIIGEPVDVIGRLREEGRVDVVYVRGHPLVPLLRRAFPDLKICLELYLYPWDSVEGGQEKRDKSALAYPYIDAFTVIGKTYHRLSLQWFRDYDFVMRPNMVIYPTYDDTVPIDGPRDYLVGIFDSISPPHCTVEAVRALELFYETHDCQMPSVIGCSCVKDRGMFDAIKEIVAGEPRIELVYPDLIDVASYYARCKAVIALYSHPEEEYTYLDGKRVRNFLVPIRLIEALGYGCIPIVTDNMANEEITEGQWILRVPDKSGDEIISLLVDKIKRAASIWGVRPSVIGYSNKKMGEKLYRFLRSL